MLMEAPPRVRSPSAPARISAFACWKSPLFCGIVVAYPVIAGMTGFAPEKRDMHLTPQQNDRFFGIMNALLLYVNERFSVVTDFMFDDFDPAVEVKASIVAQTLWENVEVIEDFVRENPYGLSQSDLRIAEAWKDRLQGVFTLVRHENGLALLMDGENVFAVAGLEVDMDEALGRPPALVEAVLLPFGDLIVYDGFAHIGDTGSDATSRRAVEDAFEKACANGIVAHAEDFTARARALNTVQRERDLDDLLASFDESLREGADEPPAGFFRGALAGMTEDEREAAIEAHANDLGLGLVEYRVEHLKQVAVQAAPETSLDGCLSTYEKGELQEVARALELVRAAPQRKSALVRVIADDLLARPEELERALSYCSSDAFATICRLAEEGSLVVRESDIDADTILAPCEPYSFLFYAEATFTALVPDELRDMVARVDFEAVKLKRAREYAALNCAGACVTYCGVVRVADAYGQYRAASADPLSYDEFIALLADEVLFGQSEFETWELEGEPYLMHYTLSPEFVAEQAVQSRRSELLEQFEQAESADAFLLAAREQITASLQGELENVDDVRRYLAEEHARVSMRPLGELALDDDPLRAFFALPSVVMLRNFLDAHVPSDEDEFFFADRVVEGVVMTVLEVGDVNVALSYVKSLGLDECAHDRERLPKLVTNVFNALPSWENNGWSPAELQEQLTGRTLFYDENGDVMKVGRNDPCPCGSGKKYKRCHGR